MNTTKLRNGMSVLAHDNGDAKKFSNHLQAKKAVASLLAQGWAARVGRTPMNERVFYVVFDSFTDGKPSRLWP